MIFVHLSVVLNWSNRMGIAHSANDAESHRRTEMNELNQEQIRDLLAEASTSTDGTRLRDIVMILRAGAEASGMAQGAVNSMVDLYIETQSVFPQYLPYLFPSFALVCASNGPADVLRKSVNWELAPRIPEGEPKKFEE